MRDRPSTFYAWKIDHNSVHIPNKIGTDNEPFMCTVPSFSSIGICVYILWLQMQSVQKDEEIKKLFQKFARLYLGIGWHNFASNSVIRVA